MPQIAVFDLHATPLTRSGAAPAVEAKQRDRYFDVLKGFLVLVMVAHHTLEYFEGRYFPLIRYVDFVTGGFVFAAGFLPSFLLHSKPSSDGFRTARRLLTRGVKLLLVFVAVNILIGLIFGQTPRGKSFGAEVIAANLSTVFLGGDKSLAAFVILVPIAYTLIAVGLLTIVGRSRWLPCAVAAALVAYCTRNPGAPFNVYFLSMGLAGAAAGVLVRPRAVAVADRWYVRVVLLCGSAAYMGAISVLQRDNALLYAAGIFFVLSAAYAHAKSLERSRVAFESLVILGRYSLFAYLAQIFFLQVLARVGSRPVMAWGLGLIPAALTTAFLCGLCFALDRLRERSAGVGYAYRLIFA
jgi:fucose 4-O-acetylase-like acetyltransferase